MFWGDIALISSRIISHSIFLHYLYNAKFTFPTCLKVNPYVSFIKNKEGIIYRVNHSNHNEKNRGYAEQDSSFFLFNKKIFCELKNFIHQHNSRLERDFVKLIPDLNNKFNLISTPIAYLNEVEGINTAGDIVKISNILKS